MMQSAMYSSTLSGLSPLWEDTPTEDRSREYFMKSSLLVITTPNTHFFLCMNSPMKKKKKYTEKSRDERAREESGRLTMMLQKDQPTKHSQIGAR